MPSPLDQPAEIESVVDADLQTGIPAPVRVALRLNPGDRLRYCVNSDGRVSLENASRPAATRKMEASPLLGLLAGVMAGQVTGKTATLPKLDHALLGSLQGLLTPEKTSTDSALDSSRSKPD